MGIQSGAVDHEVRGRIYSVFQRHIFKFAFYFVLNQPRLELLGLRGVYYNMAGVNLFLRLLTPRGGLDRRRQVGGLGRRRSAVFNADDVISVSRFNQFAGGLALPQRERGGFKSGVHNALAEPAHVASIRFTARVVAEFTGDLLEALAFLHTFEQPLSLLFLLIRVGARVFGQIFLPLVVSEFVLLLD